MVLSTLDHAVVPTLGCKAFQGSEEEISDSGAGKDLVWADDDSGELKEVQEMLLNVERALRIMDENGLDGLLATTLENVYYLSGFFSPGVVSWARETQLYALASRKTLSHPVIIVPTAATDITLDCFPGVRVLNYGVFYREVAGEGAALSPSEVRLKKLTIDRQPKADALEALMAALDESGLADKTIGVDERGINACYVPELEKHFPSLKIKLASPLFRQIRMVKTAEEIKRLRAAVEAAEKAMLQAVSIAREGMTEEDIAKEFQKVLIEQGAQPFFTCLHFGRLSAFGQRPPGDAPLRKGDRIWFDVGCIHQGYASDIARTFAFGEVGDRARRYYEALLEGEERALETIKAGIKAEDVFHCIVAAVREAGIPHFRRHHVGHGIGLETYDPPLLAPGDQTVLEEGMVLNIESPYYEIGTGALMVEDTLLVTTGRPELLTSISRQLTILE